MPLLGGSGGGGGRGGGGGAGGGALLIASSVSITINGVIMANGGLGGQDGACRGGGGAIRLIAPTISGTGTLNARGGVGPPASFHPGSPGRIRLEAFQQQFTGSTDPMRVVASPFALFLPTELVPIVRAVAVNGAPVPLDPTGSFEMPDVIIDQATAVTVDIEARNVPLGTIVKLHIFSENGPDQVIDSTPLMGTLAQSTVTVSVVLPPGFSRGFVRAQWTAQ